MFKNTSRSDGNRNQRNNPYLLDEMAVRFHRSAAGVAWRWRTEVLGCAAITVTLWRLAIMGAIILGTTAVALLAVPGSRRFTVRRMWCVLARHRIQRLCYEARLHTRSGRLPLVLWTRPTKVGERAHLLCRAGICAEDFQAHIGEIRAACYAREARVTRNLRWSQLVTIDIIRRDTLAASHHVPSPLHLIHRTRPAVTSTELAEVPPPRETTSSPSSRLA
jgi:hypothetical protein